MEELGGLFAYFNINHNFWHSRHDFFFGTEREKRGYHVEMFGIQTDVTLDPNGYSFK